MATWTASNIVITNKGLEVLSKVQAGTGKITISRIVAGSGSVASNLLTAQVAVSGEKLTLNLTSVDTDVNGSILNMAMSNTGLQAPFTMNQLGVYVTHVDYPGEVLYLLAQCDSGTGDNIPLPTTTPTVSYFSIYMEHTGVSSENVTINVAESGVATKSIIQDDTISTSWTGSSAPYTQEHNFAGSTSASVIEIVLPSTATVEQVAQFQQLNLQDGGQGVGTFTLKAFGDKNTIPIPIKVIKRGDF